MTSKLTSSGPVAVMQPRPSSPGASSGSKSLRASAAYSRAIRYGTNSPAPTRPRSCDSFAGRDIRPLSSHDLLRITSLFRRYSATFLIATAAVIGGVLMGVIDLLTFHSADINGSGHQGPSLG